MSLFKFGSRTVGIDIGGSSVKIVEISRFRKKSTLRNYAFLESAIYDGQPFRAFEQETLFLSSERAAEAARACLAEAGIKPEKVAFSLPDFSSFFVSFDLPPMSGGELVKAINFQASKYIPVPMNEIVLDWQKVGAAQEKSSRAPMHILVVAIPRKTMEQYRKVAELLGAKDFAMEPEAFSLFRVFAPRDDKPICVIDLGAKSTTVSFGDRGGLHSSHSLDVAVEKAEKVLAEKLDVSEEEAQRIIRQEGFSTLREEVRKALTDLFSPLPVAFKESWQTLQRRGTVGNVSPRVLLAGGAAAMPGLPDHLASVLDASVEIGRPFQGVSYPTALKPVAEDIGSAFSVAVGAALRKI